MPLLLGTKIKTIHIFSPICQPLRVSGNKLPAFGQLDRLALEQTSAVTGTPQEKGRLQGPEKASGQLRCGHQRDPADKLEKASG